MFVVLAMVLRKPDVLLNLLPILREHPKYQAKDNFPITIWMIAQASEGDLVVGLFMWTRFLLPVLNSTANRNSESNELILPLIERILSSPKSRAVLLSKAVQKNEPLVPPSTLDFFMRTTYPASSAIVEATERFKAVYPTLKEIALSGGSKSHVATQEIINFAIIAAGEGVPDLSREATDIFVWCLTQGPEFYRHWDRLHLDIEASVVILRKLSDELKLKSAKDSTLELLKETLKSFRQKNAKTRGKTEDGGRKGLREADELCKAILGQQSKRGKKSKGGQVSKSYGFMKAVMIVSALSTAILSLNVVNQNL